MRVLIVLVGVFLAMQRAGLAVSPVSGICAKLSGFIFTVHLLEWYLNTQQESK